VSEGGAIGIFEGTNDAERWFLVARFEDGAVGGGVPAKIKAQFGFHASARSRNFRRRMGGCGDRGHFCLEPP
jgi:hypothetical protein